MIWTSLRIVAPMMSILGFPSSVTHTATFMHRPSIRLRSSLRIPLRSRWCVWTSCRLSLPSPSELRSEKRGHCYDCGVDSTLLSRYGYVLSVSARALAGWHCRRRPCHRFQIVLGHEPARLDQPQMRGATAEVTTVAAAIRDIFIVFTMNLLG